jgi:hypothetical protein
MSNLPGIMMSNGIVSGIKSDRDSYSSLINSLRALQFDVHKAPEVNEFSPCMIGNGRCLVFYMDAVDSTDALQLAALAEKYKVAFDNVVGASFLDNGNSAFNYPNLFRKWAESQMQTSSPKSGSFIGKPSGTQISAEKASDPNVAAIILRTGAPGSKFSDESETTNLALNDRPPEPQPSADDSRRRIYELQLRIYYLERELAIRNAQNRNPKSPQ